MTKAVFIDTSTLVALAQPRDQHHERARDISSRLGKRPLVGTTAVLTETHGLLIHRIGHSRAGHVVRLLLSDPAYRWHDVTFDLVSDAASRWVQGFGDQEFSLTDAVSFEVMTREGLDTAFAFDQHFVTAGFRLLA